MPTLGIDLGGTNARAAVVDERGQILAAAKMALTERSPAAVVESIAQAAAEAVALAGVKVAGCGVGAAGQIPGDSGVLAVAPNLGWRNVPLGGLLRERLGLPVRLVNDLAAAAWGEFNAGAGRGAQDVYVSFVGSGVGSCIIANGQLVRGAGGVAGELGHTKVIPGGRRCGCGELGCLEAYSGGHNLIALTQELLASGRSSVLNELTAGVAERITPLTLERAAEAGDPGAVEIHARAGKMLGTAIANMVTVLNPARLILGGGVLMNCPGLRRYVVEAVQSQTSNTAREGLLIAEAELGDDSGLIGAALLG
ncbi:ROK family protein [Stigmatella aurantiaca]|uniref:Glucokinase n=1 Tax=Stigmatella aurantiaca (strain DW4/3-1) TaxID=378806 RepID=Q08WY0_STIAD|nr:ROK family protein [Stigmatella aurantiaca]ADO75015.1 Glucokinase [Stigmatella aurantiaca DW4/3-1]EAU64986.1 glucokinase [Stigmatella aurantiaca DW4/3-1]